MSGIDLYTLRAEIFKALGHPTRARFVDALCNGEQCVCDLQKLVGSDMSTVSKHLSVLKNAGVVTDEKRANRVYYTLAMPCLDGFLHCVDSLIMERYGNKPFDRANVPAEPGHCPACSPTAMRSPGNTE